MHVYVINCLYQYCGCVVAGYTGSYKAKRARSHGAKNRTILQLYNKLSEIISLLSELVELQKLTDNIILQV